MTCPYCSKTSWWRRRNYRRHFRYNPWMRRYNPWMHRYNPGMGPIEGMRPGRYHPKREPSKRCQYPGCSQTTNEGKPFCSDHIEEDPRVRALQARLAAHEAAQEEGIITADDITLEDMLIILRQGPRTIERLARDLRVTIDMVKRYVAYAKKQGLVATGPGARKTTVVHLVEKQSKRKWKCKKKAKRKSKKKAKRKCRKRNPVKRKCSNCHKPGHYASTCKN